MQDAAGEAHRYPDAAASALREALSEHTGHPADQIVLGNGSHELILLTGRLALDPGASLVCPEPTFYGHPWTAALNNARLVTVAVRSDGSCDVDAMIHAIRPDTRLVALVTPNNPTGGLNTTPEIDRLVSAVRTDTLLLVDEAYHEFGMDAGGPDVLEILRRRNGPWLLLRTFSKAYGLAGVRLGYGLASHIGLVHEMDAERGTFRTNTVAQRGALAALADQQYLADTVAHTSKERARLVAGLREFGWDPLATATNFVMARGRVSVDAVVRAFADRGTLIGTLTAPNYEDTIRITVGTAEDVDHCIGVLRELADTRGG